MSSAATAQQGEFDLSRFDFNAPYKLTITYCDGSERSFSWSNLVYHAAHANGDNTTFRVYSDGPATVNDDTGILTEVFTDVPQEWKGDGIQPWYTPLMWSAPVRLSGIEIGSGRAVSGIIRVTIGHEVRRELGPPGPDQDALTAGETTQRTIMLHRAYWQRDRTWCDEEKTAELRVHGSEGSEPVQLVNMSASSDPVLRPYFDMPKDVGWDSQTHTKSTHLSKRFLLVKSCQGEERAGGVVE